LHSVELHENACSWSAKCLSDAQGAHFWSAVEAEQFVPFGRRVITQGLDSAGQAP
jgi:hypothetical protein